MTNSLHGILSYNPTIQRYEAIFDDGSRKELHCGDVFNALIDDAYINVRIEFNWDTQTWFLVQAKDATLNGLNVQF